MPFITDIDIEITSVNNQYVATVNKLKAGSKRAGFVRWQIKRRDGFPNNASVILQFVNSPTPPKANVDGPFIDGASAGGRYSTTGNFITNLISFAANGGYNYTISYDDNGTEQLLLDPEIVVDGNAPILVKLLKSLQGDLKLIKLANSGKSKKAAKKAKPKPASRSTKRKAKKR